jgi:hypothetical protein
VRPTFPVSDELVEEGMLLVAALKQMVERRIHFVDA